MKVYKNGPYKPKVPKQIEKGEGGVGCVHEGLLSSYYLHLDIEDMEAIPTMRGTNNTFLLAAAVPTYGGTRNVFNTHNGLGRGLGVAEPTPLYSTPSSNHLILMLLHCLVNQLSIYIRP